LKISGHAIKTPNNFNVEINDLFLRNTK